MRRFRDLPIARKLVISMLLTSSLALLMATVGFTAHHVVEFRAVSMPLRQPDSAFTVATPRW